MHIVIGNLTFNRQEGYEDKLWQLIHVLEKRLKTKYIVNVR